MSPDGSEVFVTGSTQQGTAEGSHFMTVAYSTSTGAKLWMRGYPSGGSLALVVSPDGSTVFVTGQSRPVGTYLTAAYDAATGATKWVRSYSGGGPYSSIATAIGISPDGATVFVTGSSGGSGAGGGDYATVAYEATSGATRWVSRYNAPGNNADDARSLAVSPDGATVFVTGSSISSTSVDIATVAYDATSGATVWVDRYTNTTGHASGGNTVQVSPDGAMVFVTGKYGPYAVTLAYSSSSGAVVWLRRYLADASDALAVSPDGTMVFASGHSYGTGSYATHAYDAATGATRWTRSFVAPSGVIAGYPVSMGVSPDGTTVFLTGQVASTNFWNYGTIAYVAATGDTAWRARFGGSNNDALASALAVSPDGSRVYVTGSILGSSAHWMFATLAYEAEP